MGGPEVDALRELEAFAGLRPAWRLRGPGWARALAPGTDVEGLADSGHAIQPGGPIVSRVRRDPEPFARAVEPAMAHVRQRLGGWGGPAASAGFSGLFAGEPARRRNPERGPRRAPHPRPRRSLP